MVEGVQSVGRALGLLEQLADAHGDLGVSELARRLDLQPPTAHRLLRTLIERGWVVQNLGTSRYRLSHKLLAIVGDVEARSAYLRSVARPYLVALRDLSGESTNLVVLETLSAVYVDQVPSRRPIRMFTEIGACVPIYASGAGKAMLAHQPPPVMRALLRRPLKRLTAHTLTDREMLEAELRQVREAGYAFDNEEYELGVSCAAAAIRDAGGNAHAAISVSAPTARWEELDRDRLGRRLAEHADEISAQLGAGRDDRHPRQLKRR